MSWGCFCVRGLARKWILASVMAVFAQVRSLQVQQCSQASGGRLEQEEHELRLLQWLLGVKWLADGFWR